MPRKFSRFGNNWFGYSAEIKDYGERRVAVHGVQFSKDVTGTSCTVFRSYVWSKRGTPLKMAQEKQTMAQWLYIARRCSCIIWSATVCVAS
eukprot:TRINITY_DN67889_c9_g3_i1.p1 TRINITY_DN67889_c9_g3~~TRINITY_DN67889_c9_g3_i1.p1  ORF type:complete len:103 (+),score=10.08 TRINITY_DN67889_c9_g3_i1:39-311(+)